MLRLTSLALVALLAQQAPANTAVLVGRVLDQADGKPIGGAVVEITSGVSMDGTIAVGAITRRQMTDALGRFVFRELAGGSYRVRATAGGTGYSPNGFIINSSGFPIGRYIEGGYGQQRPGGPTQTLAVADGQIVPDVVIRLWRGGAISGVIVDDTGEPVVDTVVGAVRVSSDGRLLNGPTVRTDDRGMYRLSALVPGKYIVFVPQTTTAMSAEAADEQLQRLAELMSSQKPGAPLAIVPDVQGIPVGDSIVRTATAGLIDGNIMPRRQGDATFVFQTTFHPAATVLTGALPIEVRAGDDRNGVDVSLQPVRAVSVSATLMWAGSSLGGRRVRLMPAASPDASLFETALSQTDALGRVTFPLVPAGSYRVSLGDSSNAGAWLNDTVSVGQSAVKDLVWTVRPGLNVTGAFEFAGSGARPAPGMTAGVGLREASPGSRTLRATQTLGTGGSTTFSAEGIPAGRYFARVTGVPPGWFVQSVFFGGRDLNDLPFDLTENIANVRVVLTDRPASIAGRVTSSSAGEAGPAILVFPAESTLWPDARGMTRRVRLVRPADSGDFLIGDMPPGDYLAVAVLDAASADWPDADFLSKLAPQATSVRVRAGERAAISLTTKKIQ